ncbi:unnamed protein product [Protopolystoma xenopodis]|uniref:Uncharacterized protein n=1 Tax=Protopolystoma xenopodis TaxID=117903 RepID=A0A3S5B4P9_9PLAT|nr:unnamed protein product [Protopolystoma xenopodis]
MSDSAASAAKLCGINEYDNITLIIHLASAKPAGQARSRQDERSSYLQLWVREMTSTVSRPLFLSPLGLIRFDLGAACANSRAIEDVGDLKM